MHVSRRLVGLALLGSVLTAALSLSVPGGPNGAAGAASAVDAGTVTPWGAASPWGAPTQLNAPLAGMVPTPDGGGYWLVAADGGVFAYGDAPFEGSASSGVPGMPELDGLPTVGMAATPDGKGYWLIDGIGHVSSFGDATTETWPGTVGDGLQRAIVGMAATHDGHGTWLVGADGGVFALGDAAFHGSAAALPLNAPVVAMTATPDGGGYWLVAADGGVFAYGDARFFGSAGGLPLQAPVVAMTATPDGGGYLLVAADGGVFAYGDASFFGSPARTPPTHPMIGMAASAGGHGYWLVDSGIGPLVPHTSQVIGDCENPQVEPSTFILACADHNSFLANVTWSSWTAATAIGTGTYWQNDCTPDCAQGRFKSSPGATIELSRPIATSAGVEFTNLTVSYADPASGGAPRSETEGWYTSPT